VKGVLFAEPAVLVHFKSVGVVLLVFHCVVVALFALCASKCDFNSHNGTSRFTEIFFAFTLVKVNASLSPRLSNIASHTIFSGL
jgi:hypothetical protein